MTNTGILPDDDGTLLYRTEVPRVEGSRTLRLIEPQRDPVFDQIRELGASNQVDEALDLILATIDALLRGQRFRQCDTLLSNTPLGQLRSECVLAFLSVTRPARSQLRRRERFVEDARALLTERLGAKEASEILSGLV